MDIYTWHIILRKYGFNRTQIEQLEQLRAHALLQELLLTPAEHRRLVFVRWLVATGRLSEWMVKTEEEGTQPVVQCATIYDTIEREAGPVML